MMFLQNWYIEMGIPGKLKIGLPSDIESGEIPEGKYIRTIHPGSYMKVGKTYDRITAYAENAGLTLKDYSIERYLNDPKQISEEDLQTEVLVPIF
jgi:effector-binding domain-containing protein